MRVTELAKAAEDNGSSSSSSSSPSSAPGGNSSRSPPCRVVGSGSRIAFRFPHKKGEQTVYERWYVGTVECGSTKGGGSDQWTIKFEDGERKTCTLGANNQGHAWKHEGDTCLCVDPCCGYCDSGVESVGGHELSPCCAPRDIRNAKRCAGCIGNGKSRCTCDGQCDGDHAPGACSQDREAGRGALCVNCAKTQTCACRGECGRSQCNNSCMGCREAPRAGRKWCNACRMARQRLDNACHTCKETWSNCCCFETLCQQVQQESASPQAQLKAQLALFMPTGAGSLAEQGLLGLRTAAGKAKRGPFVHKYLELVAQCLFGCRELDDDTAPGQPAPVVDSLAHLWDDICDDAGISPVPDLPCPRWHELCVEAEIANKSDVLPYLVSALLQLRLNRPTPALLFCVFALEVDLGLDTRVVSLALECLRRGAGCPVLGGTDGDSMLPRFPGNITRVERYGGGGSSAVVSVGAEVTTGAGETKTGGTGAPRVAIAAAAAVPGVVHVLPLLRALLVETIVNANPETTPALEAAVDTMLKTAGAEEPAISAAFTALWTAASAVSCGGGGCKGSVTTPTRQGGSGPAAADGAGVGETGGEVEDSLAAPCVDCKLAMLEHWRSKKHLFHSAAMCAAVESTLLRHLGGLGPRILDLAAQLCDGVTCTGSVWQRALERLEQCPDLFTKNFIGVDKSLAAHLEPITQREVHNAMRGFSTDTSKRALDLSCTCASCGVRVSKEAETLSVEEGGVAEQLFSHENVCRQGWRREDLMVELEGGGEAAVDDDAQLKVGNVVFVRNDGGRSFRGKVTSLRRDGTYGVGFATRPNVREPIPPECPLTQAWRALRKLQRHQGPPARGEIEAARQDCLAAAKLCPYGSQLHGLCEPVPGKLLLLLRNIDWSPCRMATGEIISSSDVVRTQRDIAGDGAMDGGATDSPGNHAPGTGKKIKKGKKTKDPNAPKKPTNAYLLFCAAKRDEVKDNFPDLKGGAQLLKELAKRWKALDGPGRRPFEDEAEKDKGRYLSEIKAYSRPTSREEAAAAADDAGSGGGEADVIAAGGASSSTGNRPPVAEGHMYLCPTCVTAVRPPRKGVAPHRPAFSLAESQLQIVPPCLVDNVLERDLEKITLLRRPSLVMHQMLSVYRTNSFIIRLLSSSALDAIDQKSNPGGAGTVRAAPIITGDGKKVDRLQRAMRKHVITFRNSLDELRAMVSNGQIEGTASREEVIQKIKVVMCGPKMTRQALLQAALGATSFEVNQSDVEKWFAFLTAFHLPRFYGSGAVQAAAERRAARGHDDRVDNENDVDMDEEKEADATTATDEQGRALSLVQGSAFAFEERTVIFHNGDDRDDVPPTAAKCAACLVDGRECEHCACAFSDHGHAPGECRKKEREDGRDLANARREAEEPSDVRPLRQTHELCHDCEKMRKSIEVQRTNRFLGSLKSEGAAYSKSHHDVPAGDGTDGDGGLPEDVHTETSGIMSMNGDAFSDFDVTVAGLQNHTDKTDKERAQADKERAHAAVGLRCSACANDELPPCTHCACQQDGHGHEPGECRDTASGCRPERVRHELCVGCVQRDPSTKRLGGRGRPKPVPNLAMVHGGDPINEFVESDLLSGANAPLFPNGRGLYKDESRERQYTIHKWRAYLGRLHNRDFVEHHSFMFELADMVNRHAVLRAASIRVAMPQGPRLDDLSSGKLKQIVRSLKRYGLQRTGEKFPGFYSLLGNIKAVGGTVKGSPYARGKYVNNIRGLMTVHGLPNIWLTMNLHDLADPHVLLYTGATAVKLSIPLNKREQARLIAKDPFACAEWFNHHCLSILKNLFGDGEGSPRGLFGTCEAFAAVKEAYGRGSLHGHYLLWTKEMGIIQALLKRPDICHRYESRIAAFVDSIVSCDIKAIATVAATTELCHRDHDVLDERRLYCGDKAVVEGEPKERAVTHEDVGKTVTVTTRPSAKTHRQFVGTLTHVRKDGWYTVERPSGDANGFVGGTDIDETDIPVRTQAGAPFNELRAPPPPPLSADEGDLPAFSSEFYVKAAAADARRRCRETDAGADLQPGADAAGGVSATAAVGPSSGTDSSNHAAGNGNGEDDGATEGGRRRSKPPTRYQDGLDSANRTSAGATRSPAASGGTDSATSNSAAATPSPTFQDDRRQADCCLDCQERWARCSPDDVDVNTCLDKLPRAKLTAALQARGLPSSGKGADKVKRLTDYLTNRCIHCAACGPSGDARAEGDVYCPDCRASTEDFLETFVRDVGGIVVSDLQHGKRRRKRVGCDTSDMPADVQEMVTTRATAKLEKDWAKADLLRNALVGKGYHVSDPKGRNLQEVFGVRVLGRRCLRVCFKYGKARQRGLCRLGYSSSGRPLVDFTHIGLDGKLEVKRSSFHVVPHSVAATYVLRCNNCVELLFTGRSAQAVALYVTSYMTKVRLTLDFFKCTHPCRRDSLSSPTLTPPLNQPTSSFLPPLLLHRASSTATTRLPSLRKRSRRMRRFVILGTQTLPPRSLNESINR